MPLAFTASLAKNHAGMSPRTAVTARGESAASRRLYLKGTQQDDVVLCTDTATYAVTLSYDDGGGPAILRTTWKTLPPPAHPALHVKYITAIPADAVLDMAHRIDKANVVAVPTNADFIDASTRSLSASAYAAALKHHQSALVVTDMPVLSSDKLGAALNQFCNNGHGVVLAGQTHWRADAATPWNVTSAIGGETGPWATHWSLFGYR